MFGKIKIVLPTVYTWVLAISFCKRAATKIHKTVESLAITDPIQQIYPTNGSKSGNKQQQTKNNSF